jgi:hypothetical protein
VYLENTNGQLGLGHNLLPEASLTVEKIKKNAFV